MIHSALAGRLRPVALACACASFALSARAAEPAAKLEAVVVTASRTETASRDLVADVVVIDRDTLDQSAGATLTEVLRQHAGVQIASNGGWGKQASVFLRGTEARHALLLIDGVRYGSATLGQPNWDNLPLEAIERIEVLRGPAAALYGSDAVGGVVQIFTRAGAEGPARPHAGATVGSYGRRETRAGVSGGTAQVRYALGVSAGREDGFSATNERVPFGNFNPDRDGFEQRALHARLDADLAPGLRLAAHALVSSGDSQFDSSLNGSASFDVHGLTTTRVWGVTLTQAWTGGGRTQLKFGRADDLTRNLYRTATTVFDTERRQWTLQHDQPTSLGTFTVGVDHVREEVNSTTAYTVRDRNLDGVFAGWHGRAGAHRWQANVRRDDNSQFGGATTGSLGYGYDVAPGWTVLAAAGTSFKAPTFNQLYFPQFGNPTTQPEKGRSRELALQWAQGPHQWRLTYFEQRIRGYITTTPVVVNLPKVAIDGWSFTGQTVLDGWRIGGSLELLEARNRTPGSNFDRRLPRRAEEQLTLTVERSLVGWWVGAQALLVGDRFDDVANTRRMGGFGTLGLTAQRALAPGWTLRLRLDNLADKRYETAWGYNQPGRAAYVTLQWQPPR
ncbi:Vitamin B12 transporter BtuB [Tepidimonas alkaliphilus]|uniref:Vitamin B12 transporter BtuB n=1 Tax=Tepidimonas alkaliphilus TaxID=2588942 RepID=A0A554WD98_9BURK|nr:TonB-dependent receptor [Tepidimonas alkaliphilus]TSE21517.1 Vitamin B12 transporter BtuB [Tepidimonas alkaliphilus]